MTPDQSERIATQLATLTESVAGIRRDIERQDQVFEIERQESHLSRKDLHEKVNSVVQDMTTLKGDIRVAAEVTAQTRETLKSLGEKFEKAAPTIEQVEQAKRVGAWIIGGGAAAAIASGLAVLAWGESVKLWLSHWLGIPPHP